MIHYHGSPISGSEFSQLAFAGKHAMVSHAGPDNIDLISEVCQSFVLDNGAFSNWKSGKAFDFGKYAAFVDHWARHPACDWYVIPDVIDGTEQENKDMRTRWANAVDSSIYRKGVPVWHLNESLSILGTLVEQFPMVAFGSAGDFATVGDMKWWSRMAAAMEFCADTEGRPLTKLHGLRMLDPDVFTHLPLSSADSTNVARSAGMDARWIGPYAPASRKTRALLMMERIESHASAKRWAKERGFRNWELFG